MRFAFPRLAALRSSQHGCRRPLPSNCPRSSRLSPCPPPSPTRPPCASPATEVLVPTLVEKRGGGIVYGLKQGDFVLEDNGVPQKIRVQEEMDTAPVALVVAVEQGGVSVLEFDKLAKLGPLLDLFLTDPRSEAALMGFDSKPHLIRDYTHSSEAINDALNHLQPGDGGAAILDTISSAVDLLETQPKEYPPGPAAYQRGARPRQQAHQGRSN